MKHSDNLVKVENNISISLAEWVYIVVTSPKKLSDYFFERTLSNSKPLFKLFP
jgi:hypothetical protein